MWRKALLDDLSTFYDEHFGEDNDANEGDAPEHDEKSGKGGDNP